MNYKLYDFIKSTYISHCTYIN